MKSVIDLIKELLGEYSEFEAKKFSKQSRLANYIADNSDLSDLWPYLALTHEFFKLIWKTAMEKK